MKHRCYISSLAFVAMFSVLICPVEALIKGVEWTAESLNNSSKAVMVGKVDDVNATARVLNISLSQTLRGKSPGAKIRVQILEPKELVKEIAAGQPVVFFLTLTDNAENAVIHVADTWLTATALPNTNLLTWRVNQVFEKMQTSFPGRTLGLVKMITEVNAGTSTFLDKFEKKPFSGGMHKRAKLGVEKAAWILAEDLNGDKKPDLVVGTAAGTRVFIATGDGYEDATAQWGTLPKANFHAIADVNSDGKPDLLLDGALWINQGGKFVAAKAAFELPKGAALSAALLDVNDDQKPDAIFLGTDGDVRVYENSGSPDKAWTARASKSLWSGEAPLFAALGDFGDTGKPHALVVSKSGISRYALDADGGPVADFTRLTGTDFKKLEKHANGFNAVTAMTLSMNGGGRSDLFLYSDTGPLLLLNRGLGAFFIDEAIANTLTANGATPLPLTPSPATVWTRADLHGKGVDDVLLLGEDGTLYEIDSGAH